MFSGKTEHSTLQIKQDDKFFSRLLSKENSCSMSQPSFRRASVAVPFVWESQPGTPKYTFSEDTLPPLTPPPSFYFNTNQKPSVKKRSRSNLLFSLFPKLMNNLKKKTTPSLSSSPPSSFSSLSSSSDNSSKLGRRHFRRCKSSIDFRGDGDEEEGVGGASSPTSILCFRGSYRR